MLPSSPLSAFHRGRPIDRLIFNIHKSLTSIDDNNLNRQGNGMSFETRATEARERG